MMVEPSNYEFDFDLQLDLSKKIKRLKIELWNSVHDFLASPKNGFSDKLLKHFC